jgi:hypothetical protein
VDLSEIEKAVTGVEGVDKAVILCYKPNEPAQKVLCFFSSGADKKVSITLQKYWHLRLHSGSKKDGSQSKFQ